MRFSIVIVRPPGYRYSDCFREVSETVMYGLRALGHEVEITENSFRHGDKHIIFGGHLLSADSTLPPGSILYNLEQVGAGNIGNLAILGGRYTIWDFAKPNCDEWAKRRIQSVHVPIGYSPEMTRIPPAEEDIDVLFYGSMNQRRSVILEQLHKLGLKVVVKINTAYGAELDELIARAKVILNIHFCDAQLFEIVRVGYALANKKAVVSEQSVDDYPQLRYGICCAPYLALVQRCVELVKYGTAHKDLGQTGFNAFSKMPETDFLSAAIGQEVLQPT